MQDEINIALGGALCINVCITDQHSILRGYTKTSQCMGEWERVWLGKKSGVGSGYGGKKIKNPRGF
jgi:hypothetical protein